MGFANVGLLTLPKGNPAGNTLTPGSPDLHILEIEAPAPESRYTAFGRHPHHELAPWCRVRRLRFWLRLACYRYRNFSMVHAHRQVRHQRALDVPNHLLRRKLCGRQNMDLFYRAAFAFYDFRGDNSR